MPHPGPAPGDERTRRRANRSELPLLAASMLYLASYTVRVLVPGLPGALDDACLAVTALTWAAFVVDFAVRWARSGEGARFPRVHWLDALTVVLPLLRPLRVVAVYDAVQRRRDQPRLSLHARVVTYAGLSVLLLGFAAAVTVYALERGAPGATIRTFGDALWFTGSSLTTTGYGDVTPVTWQGRTVALALTGCGLALLGAVTGSFSSWLVNAFTRDGEGGPTGPPSP